MRPFALGLCGASLLYAHAISISSGELALQPDKAHFTLKVPLYETIHVASPETELLKQFTFTAHGVDAHLTKSACRPEKRTDQYICDADYSLPARADRVEVSCTLPDVLVPAHVHMLRVTDGTRSGQAVFDRSFSRAPVELRQQTALHVALRDFLGGAKAAVAQTGLCLVLLAIGLAARSLRELSIFTAALAAGEILIVTRRTDYLWKLSPYFVEAALGLTVAYLAGEMLFFRNEGKRWVVVGLLAVWMGCYLKINYAASGESTTPLLLGVLLSQVAVLAAVYAFVLWGRRTRWRDMAQQWSAGSLLCAGLGWFFWRWWS